MKCEDATAATMTPEQRARLKAIFKALETATLAAYLETLEYPGAAAGFAEACANEALGSIRDAIQGLEIIHE